MLSLFYVEAAGLFKTAINCYWTAWHLIPEDSVPHWYCCENFKYDSCIDDFTHKQYIGGAAAIEFNKKHLFVGLEVEVYGNKDPR
jgi:hypothetical protein